MMDEHVGPNDSMGKHKLIGDPRFPSAIILPRFEFNHNPAGWDVRAGHLGIQYARRDAESMSNGRWIIFSWVPYPIFLKGYNEYNHTHRFKVSIWPSKSDLPAKKLTIRKLVIDAEKFPETLGKVFHMSSIRKSYELENKLAAAELEVKELKAAQDKASYRAVIRTSKRFWRGRKPKKK